MNAPKARAQSIADRLAELYPDAECELDYETPWQLLVATVLSAQCTDKRVNQVTPEFFRRWPDAKSVAAADITDLEETIRSTGFFRNKSRSLKAAAKIVATEFGGELPPDYDALIDLPGVGAKTAKVVLGEAFGMPAGVAVDTHVNRLSRRLGLTKETASEAIAGDLEGLLPRERWIDFSLRVILHGRRVCSARSPNCDECQLVELCPQIGL